MAEWIENVAERANGMKGNAEIGFADISLQTNVEIIHRMGITVTNMRSEVTNIESFGGL